MRPYFERDGITLHLGDCRDVLPTLEAGSVGLVLADPPYGINHPTNYNERGRGSLARTRDYPPVHGDTVPFDPTPLLAIAPCVLWGANYYADRLPPSGSWLVWDKRCGVGVNDQADAELAWSNATKGVRVFQHMWNGMLKASERGESYHPTQKPVALMSWVLGKVGAISGRVLDPYMGAGPVALACQRLGLGYVGIEIEERYCEIAAKRLSQQVLL